MAGSLLGCLSVAKMSCLARRLVGVLLLYKPFEREYVNTCLDSTTVGRYKGICAGSLPEAMAWGRLPVFTTGEVAEWLNAPVC